LPLVVDVRSEEAVKAAVAQTVETFGGIDICVNNASAIQKSGTLDTEMKRFDLMHQVNARGTFLVAQACLPHLKRSANPHVLVLSPPILLDPKWLAPHVAYTMSKYGMSLCVLGMAEEFRKDGVAFNALWPRYGVATAAIEFAVADSAELRRCRKPEIMADAAYEIFGRSARECSGNFFIDDEVLASAGVADLDAYRLDLATELRAGMFIPEPA
jgi:citronellol/citronellal dehydrogenase